ncbi:MAG: hypothetical protein M3306_03920, partial [Actinomycetota bacterium]|nr:hypothetical protein [Actinomycetota bacterium]
VALLLLRLDSAILTSTMWFVLKLGLIAVLTVLAWRLTRPAAYSIPGLDHVRRAMRQRLAIRHGAQDGLEAAARPQSAISSAVPASRPAFIPGYSDRPAHASYGYVLPERERPDVLAVPRSTGSQVVPGHVVAITDALTSRSPSGHAVDSDVGPAVAAQTGAPVRIRRPDAAITEVHSAPTVPRLSTEERSALGSYLNNLRSNGRIRSVDQSGAEYEFQRRHCGPVEYRLTEDEKLPQAAWADGINEEFGAAQDAKHVGDGDSSFYRPDSLPPFLRERAVLDMDDRLLKYKGVIDDDQIPINGLEIVTNNDEAAQFIHERMTHLKVPGWVRTEHGEEDDDA